MNNDSVLEMENLEEPELDKHEYEAAIKTRHSCTQTYKREGEGEKDRGFKF